MARVYMRRPTMGDIDAVGVIVLPESYKLV